MRLSRDNGGERAYKLNSTAANPDVFIDNPYQQSNLLT